MEKVVIKSFRELVEEARSWEDRNSPNHIYHIVFDLLDRLAKEKDMDLFNDYDDFFENYANEYKRHYNLE